MCPSPHNIGPNPPNMVKHSALSIVPTEYIEKIHQLLLLIFLRPRSVTGNLGSECKYRVLGPDYSINPPEYKSFKAFCEPFDLSLSYVKTSCQLPLQHLVPLRYPRMSAKSPFWPTVGAYSQNQVTRIYLVAFQFFYPIFCGINIQFYHT